MIQNINTILINIESSIKAENELDYFYTHSSRYQFLLNKLVKFPVGKVLDVGCYPYHLGAALEDLGFDVFGISSPHEPIKDKPKVKILNIETEKFPFKDEEFDLVLFTEVIEHLLNPKVPLKEIHRVLKKNGTLILTTPNKISPLIAFRRIFFTRKNEKEGSSIYNQHNKEYSMGELKKLSEENGWKITKEELFISYTLFRKRKIPDNLFMKIIKLKNFLLMKIFPFLRDTLYIEAIKN